MAVWQSDYFLMPASSGTNVARILIDESQSYWREFTLVLITGALERLGPPAPTWCPGEVRWGEEDGDCVYLSTEDGRVDELRFRLDHRREQHPLIESLLDIARGLGLLLASFEGAVIETSFSAVMIASRGMATAAFVEDPHAFLERLPRSDN